MTLSAMGDAETPAGGSVCIRYDGRILLAFWGPRRKPEGVAGEGSAQNDTLKKLTLKSRMRRRRAEVDILQADFGKESPGFQ